ncbi:hypothetical protein JZO78_09460 [Enterococcus ureilyticus]|uniref:hypothetical protein n=1 Tax=Enterococcus ureilyticus TaxID=1131292 RepID=UPI001A92BF9D|nr:hypothetical protein [Enterococcus ureilyticus]MBO0446572.1 hypothetical protein [Enterococcus ureilyticus]
MIIEKEPVGSFLVTSIFNKNTLVEVDRVVLVYVNVEETSLKILYDELKYEAEKLMVDSSDGNAESISMSKVMNKKRTHISKLTILNSVNYKNYRIQRFENGKIQVSVNELEVNPVKAVLRKIAKEIGVDINNSNSNMKNTRVLGWDIIKQLS